MSIVGAACESRVASTIHIPHPRSKRNIIVLKLLFLRERRLLLRALLLRRPILLRRPLGGRTAARWGVFVITAAASALLVSTTAATAPATTVAAADELEVLDDDGQLRSLAAPLLVLP